MIGLDTGNGKVRWRQNGKATRAQVVNGFVLLNFSDGDNDRRSVVVDPAGRQLLTEQAQIGAASWVDGNALLVLQARQGDPAVTLSGVSPLSGRPVPLGTITVQDVRDCGWSRTRFRINCSACQRMAPQILKVISG